MNLKKTGKRILLLTLVVLVAMNFLHSYLPYTMRLFVGSFGFGSGFVLITIGKNDKYKW